MPLFRREGSYFGTLCALDTEPASLSERNIIVFELLAQLIAYELEAEEHHQRREAALRASQEMAQMRERFIGILGHDLRNPLSAIVVAAEIMRHDDSLTPDNALLSQTIFSSSQRIARMIEDTLDLTRGRLGGGIPIHRAKGDLNAICQQVAQESRVAHPHRAIVLQSHAGGQGEFDSARAAQVISNLLSNALQYGLPDQPVTITLRGDEHSIWVDVHNYGSEIPREKQQTLFDPFRRGHQEYERSSQGLGLGLYIASEIMQAHGGEISVQSNESGNTFTTRWPRHGAE